MFEVERVVFFNAEPTRPPSRVLPGALGAPIIGYPLLRHPLMRQPTHLI